MKSEYEGGLRRRAQDCLICGLLAATPSAFAQQALPDPSVGLRRQQDNEAARRALVPQLYALVDPSSNALASSLISANGMNIKLLNGLLNSHTLSARLAIYVGSITDVLCRMQGKSIDLLASGGINSNDVSFRCV
ncbi:hypothetical protein F3K02_21665 [Hydrogenophaga sp. D2P1]|uniref:Uncharacterized protein n=1 Tax=Hydrogenophaga aromaticivorans TaxID=2610898 RepID=A0A7Y8H1E9_9BURK|nr:hypothetical protein [Hydrogenophaga aromaticivorans]NWF47837.1 hypothetical protein [Hydrogenophaga aromaticivorans]